LKISNVVAPDNFKMANYERFSDGFELGEGYMDLMRRCSSRKCIIQE